MGQQKLQIVLSAMECVKRASDAAFSEAPFALRPPGDARTIRPSQKFNRILSPCKQVQTKSRVFEITSQQAFKEAPNVSTYAIADSSPGRLPGLRQ
jgi:hypothetical protein